MNVTALLFIITTSLVSPNIFTWLPESYDGIPQDDVKILFFDDFTNDKEFWKKSDFKAVKLDIDEGICELKAKGEQQIWQEFIMDKDGFELETVITFGKTKGNEPLNLFLFGSKTQMLTFSIYPSGHYKSTIINSKNKKDYIGYTASKSINQKDNKITIRKVDGMLYFFINEQLIASRPLPKVSGFRYGFSTTKNQLNIKYFIMSDLVRDNRNTDFNMKDGELIDVEEKSRFKM